MDLSRLFPKCIMLFVSVIQEDKAKPQKIENLPQIANFAMPYLSAVCVLGALVCTILHLFIST